MTAQQNLFDPDDPRLDVPVPFTLTGRGRRIVEDLPPLRVVDDPADDERFVRELDHTDTWRQARVRAMGRAGHGTAAIAAETGLAESVVHLWLDRSEVDADAGLDGVAVGSAATRPDQDTDDRVADARGRAILATCGTLEVGAVTATTSRIAVAATLVDWLRTTHDVADGRVRVVLRVADRSTADLVARAWADRLGLTPDRVSTVAWSSAPSPRAVQAMVRVTGRDLADRLRHDLAGWPTSATPAATVASMS
ncbi:hypothetical protein [Salsipaludibacter albus]|uniref:hypothetical protein n=1 Tax=Salsipaludibacter albus TaxID=2849650 RepID=UPI001EE4CFE8|nr:hypothetical protein [Salsipaludibacter albus]MBY5164412.1 hypothetical protein [Salsipaludibacter albus]